MLKTRGIVFRTVKYGETSVIADIFTEERGLHTFVAGGVRAAKSRMPFNLFQPMTVVDMVTYFREDSHALNRLKELRAGHVFRSIPFDIRRGAVALFLAEVCRKSIHEADENRPLFEFLLDVLIFLDETPHPFANLHLHFLLQLSGFLGFQPHEDFDAGGAALFFDLKDGLFLPAPPAHPHYLAPAAAAQVLALLHVPLEHSHEIAITRPERKHLLESLLKFYALHVPNFSEVHTPEILELVLG
ncbi:MAG: DNA repair protein RecO [Saprospiraceae bacterium]